MITQNQRSFIDKSYSQRCQVMFLNVTCAAFLLFALVVIMLNLTHFCATRFILQTQNSHLKFVYKKRLDNPVAVIISAIKHFKISKKGR